MATWIALCKAAGPHRRRARRRDHGGAFAAANEHLPFDANPRVPIVVAAPNPPRGIGIDAPLGKTDGVIDPQFVESRWVGGLSIEKLPNPEP